MCAPTINTVNIYTKHHLKFRKNQADNLEKLYTKHHLKFRKNQADNLAYIGFRRRFFPVFYWCLVLAFLYWISAQIFFCILLVFSISYYGVFAP